MTPIDWNNKNNSGRGSWGRFGEPDESYLPQVHSLKLPKRRESFDGSDSSHSEEDEKLQQPAFNSTMCSPTMMLASSANSSISRSNSIGTFGRQGRLRRRSFRRPVFQVGPLLFRPRRAFLSHQVVCRLFLPHRRIHLLPVLRLLSLSLRDRHHFRPQQQKPPKVLKSTLLEPTHLKSLSLLQSKQRPRRIQKL